MIRKNNKTLSQAFMDLKLKDEMLNETISIKDKFFHIIAHDLRNPLGVFLNISDYISNNYKEMTEDDLQQFLYDLKRSSKHLNVLLDNLILWSNLQTGKVNMTPEHFLISVLCTQLERDWRETSKTKNLTILSEYSDSKKITADMNMTIFIFKNLVTNAIKYSNDNQTIYIRTYELGENVVFEVKDNGVGIDSARAEKLFHYDKSLKTKGTQMESGTGLGLILVKQLLELNNGRLEFDTKPNEGSTFRAFFS
jgi:signal transduction histidine kinase